MRGRKRGGGAASKLLGSTKLSDLLRSDRKIESASDDDDSSTTTTGNIVPSATASPGYSSDKFFNASSAETSPYITSPWNPAASPFINSPWVHASAAAVSPLLDEPTTGLVGSLVRKEGHVYSLAAAGDLLYTGSESKNIRVWKKWREFTGFKSGSGLVKAIIIAGEKIFTGHQDGKIRVWKVSPKDPALHKRVGTLPRLKDFLRSSINPSNYVEVRRHRNTVWLRHFDAVSCLSLDEDHGLLYSGSWDKTLKVWRIADSKCLESVKAHDDAINAVATAPDGLVFSGSADGTVKVWRRQAPGRSGVTRHILVETLLRQDSAVTALAVCPAGSVVYCGSSDGQVNFWELGRRMSHGGVLRGHRMAVLCLAAAGNLAISGSADKTICVWRREAGGAHTRLSVLTGHTGPIKCLAVEEDRGSGGPGDARWVVYSGSLDRSVKVWRVSERASETLPPSPLHVQSPLHVLEGAGASEARRSSYATEGAQSGHGSPVYHVADEHRRVGLTHTGG